MSNLIPPLLSSSPPPITGPLDEDDDDEFGDFRAADSYDCDDISLPSSPQKSPDKVNLDINSNNSQKSKTEMPTKNVNESVDKDFQDRRKSLDESIDFKICENEVNCSNSQSNEHEHSEIVDQDQIENLDKHSTEPDFGAFNDQISEITNCTEIDDVSEPHCEVSSSIIKCDEIQSNIEVGDVEIVNDEDNLFEDFSVQFEKTNSDELSEINEIKSEEIVTKACENSESSMSLKVRETDPKLSDDEFGDFEGHFASEIEVKPEQEERIEEEFDDFVSPMPPPLPQQITDDEDDFGDFETPDLTEEDFGCEKPILMEIDPKNALTKSETILKDIFPQVEEDIDNFENFDDTKGNLIFDELKDVTETNALIYQWSKSNSQKMFLKALNIDMRNILYGPAWHCSMPRFAANLGLAPLEPVKTEILTPTPVQNVSSPSNSSQKNNGDIPTAQFDWNGSGLINPLDYLEQLVASLDIPSTTNPTANQSPSPSNELLDEWDLWLQSTSTERPGSVPEDSSQSNVKSDLLPTPEKSVPTLFENETLQPPPKDQINSEIIPNFELPKQLNQSDDFSPFQSPKMIPLRETHISNENINDSKPGWLEPTILTPDLPRKEPVIDPDPDEDDVEFDDFQMVLPEETKEKTVQLPDLSEFDMTITTVNKSSHNQEHIFAIPNSGPTDSSVQKQTINSNKNEEDDEFTDFHSSLPPPQPKEIFTPLQPVPLEPLKPSIQYTAPVTTQINWPDPGVTDDDIRNIELSYSRKTESQPEPEMRKESSVDDDEWSDFVSVTNPVKPVMPERTATPDLPLSVLNLNHVQAPKQPIPVITPTGLVQTKLSTNLALQPKSSNVVQTTLQPNMFRPPPIQLQPSIISSQFAANIFHSGSVQNQDDDDDWSDFVSSQPPPPQMSNGYQQKSLNQIKPPQTNWSSATTNIIMNPSHFDSFNVPQQQKKASTTRSAIPSISAMPDLDFIAPKNRTKK